MEKKVSGKKSHLFLLTQQKTRPISMFVSNTTMHVIHIVFFSISLVYKESTQRCRAGVTWGDIRGDNFKNMRKMKRSKMVFFTEKLSWRGRAKRFLVNYLTIINIFHTFLFLFWASFTCFNYASIVHLKTFIVYKKESGINW